MISFESSLSLRLFLGIILLLEKAVAKEEMDMLDKKTYYKLGLNIRALREAFGETQVQLAKAVGLKDGKSISNYEVGERTPERDILLEIAKHYRITENELIYGDFTGIKIISDIPITDKEYQKYSLEKMLPIVKSEKALKNVDFREAYEIHKRMCASLSDNGTIQTETDTLDRCINLYEKARKQGVVEAAANSLWWIMLFGFVVSFVSPKLLEMHDSDSLTLDAFLKEGFLRSLSSDSEKKQWELERLEYVKDNLQEVLLNIYILKENKEYTELADFYIALGYLLGFNIGDKSEELCAAIGIEMMNLFSILGNPYADQFLSSNLRYKNSHSL